MLPRFIDYGGVYKLAFGPKAFIVVSDPIVVKHILKVNSPGLHMPLLWEYSYPDV